MQAISALLDRDRGAQRLDNLCITESPDVLIVDFHGCDARQVASVYRALAVRLLRSESCAVLLKSGRDAPEGHVTLPDVVRLLMRHRNAWRDFSLALLPQTQRAKWVFDQVLVQYRSSGLKIRQFESERRAREWLQARSIG